MVYVDRWARVEKWQAEEEYKGGNVGSRHKPNLRSVRDKHAEELVAARKHLFLLAPDLQDRNLYALRAKLWTEVHPERKKEIRAQIDALGKVESLQCTINLLDQYVLRDMYLKTESGVAGALGSDGAISTQRVDENFLDVGGDDPVQGNAGRSNASEQGSRAITELKDFLKRPVQIYKTAIAVSATTSLALSVWDLYTLIPSVRAKLRNYTYFRGDLKVRISISGTPFHYGKILVSYQPIPGVNECLTNLATCLAANAAFRPCVLNYLSQATGSAVMSVNENTPLEITCPYISTKPMHRLYNAGVTTAMAAATSYWDLETAGDLYIYSINIVKALNATSTPIYMQVYAWMENVDLGTNTGSHLVITTESGRFGDERKTGPVEWITSKIASVSGVIAVAVPEIAPFALASQIAFSAISKVSSLFGWSKPVLEMHAKLVKQAPYSNTAVTIGSDTASRVVLDPKQEVTIDPRAAGLNFDDLSIQHIASRMTYLTTFNWLDTDDAMAGVIWSCRVHPNLVTPHQGITYNWSQPTAMAFAVAPFEFWRGDIKFRFEIVCSSFHRGKLAIFFEPNVSQYTLINSALSLNKQFLRIIDIQETQTFDIVVKWASHRSWLRNTNAATAPYNIILPSTTYQADGYVNGYIGVVPFTELQSPDTSDIFVNVYACCDNLQVNGFTSKNLPSQRRLLTEAGTFPGSCLSSVPVSTLDLNESSATVDKICVEHFGEQPLSFRALLKRKVTITNFAMNTATRQVYTRSGPIYFLNRLPFGATAVANVNFDMFSYLRYAYLGVRGAMRYTFEMTVADFARMNTFKVGFSQPADYAAIAALSAPLSETVCSNLPLEGGIMEVPHTNGGIEIEFPFYSNNLFVFAGPTTCDDTAHTNTTMEKVWYRNYTLSFNASATWTNDGSFSVCSGEDFTYLRYLGSPYYTSSPVV